MPRIYTLPTPSTRRIKKLPLSDKVILYAGRFSKEKNLPMLIEAFEMVRKVHPTATLRLVGGNPQELNHWLPEGVFVYTSYSNADNPFLPEEAASLAVIPSNHESWSRFAIEAALSGVPVVMTDVGCAGDVIKDVIKYEESGWVVKVGDTEALAEAMIEALTYQSEAELRALNALEIAEKLPTQEQTAKIMVDNWIRLCVKEEEDKCDCK